MAKVYKGIQELIGNTPLVEAVNLEKKLGLKATLLLKLEYFNPAGSVKDRIANGMIEDTKTQVEEMRRKTPSAYPAVQLSGTGKSPAEMSTAERMAAALNQTINRRK